MLYICMYNYANLKIINQNIPISFGYESHYSDKVRISNLVHEIKVLNRNIFFK